MSRFADNVDVRYAKAPQAALNSGATDNLTEVNGVAVDLQGLTGIRYRRVRVAFPYSTTLDTGRTLTLASNLQHRETATGAGSTWVDFGTAPSNHTVTNATTTDNVVTESAFEYEQDLTTVARFLRVQVTPSFSSTTTGQGLLSYSGAFVLGDPNKYPADGA